MLVVVVMIMMSTTIPTMAGPRSYHGTVVLGQVVYIVGGFDGSDYINYCCAFYPAFSRWAHVAPMHDKR